MNAESDPPAMPIGIVGRARPHPYERIRAAIVDGTFEPGAQLVESHVAAWCGVSRTPVREALTRLEQDGLVERSERGLVVKTRSPEQILNIYEVRIVLEIAAARGAAERHTAIDRSRLDRLLKQGNDADRTNANELIQRNQAFHRGVWQAGHNEALIDMLERLSLHLVRYPVHSLLKPGRWDESMKEHHDLVDAILDRDADRAAEIAQMHFEHARDIRIDNWEDDGA